MNELKRLKDRLGKITQLLDKLDQRLAQGEITEAKYKELSEQYGAEADSLKNQIAEKELMQEVGLGAEEEVKVEYPEEEPEKPVFKRPTKYCSNCGSAIDERAEICPKCGVRVSMSHAYGTMQVPGVPVPAYAKKSAGLAALLSFFIVGAGQIYCGRVLRGIAILSLSILLFLLFGYAASDSTSESTGFLFLMVILFWLWNIYDASKLAEKINRGEA